MARKAKKESSAAWRNSSIEQLQDEIRKELDGIGEKSGSKARLQYCLEAINALDRDLSPEGQLRRYIYCVSALVHHLRKGGLSPQATQRFKNLAEAILKLQRISPTNSKLGHLYGDLYLVLSQIQRKEGHPWASFWKQLISIYLSQRAPSGGKGYQAFAVGHHALRLGFGPMALKEFCRAEELGLPEGFGPRVRLERIKALRLHGDLEEAEDLAKASKGLKFTEAMQGELEWEALCRAIQKDQNLQPLIHTTRRGQKHYHPTYIMQAFFWTRAVESKEWVSRYPSLSLFASHTGVRAKSMGLLFDCGRSLDQMTDRDIPYHLRLEKLGDIIGRTDALSTIDLELLYLAAAARVLFRNKTLNFSDILVEQYTSRSLQLSGGNSYDVLGLLPKALTSASTKSAKKKKAA